VTDRLQLSQTGWSESRTERMKKMVQPPFTGVWTRELLKFY